MYYPKGLPTVTNDVVAALEYYQASQTIELNKSQLIDLEEGWEHLNRSGKVANTKAHRFLRDTIKADQDVKRELAGVYGFRTSSYQDFESFLADVYNDICKEESHAQDKLADYLSKFKSSDAPVRYFNQKGDRMIVAQTEVRLWKAIREVWEKEENLSIQKCYEILSEYLQDLTDSFLRYSPSSSLDYYSIEEKIIQETKREFLRYDLPMLMTQLEVQYAGIQTYILAH